MNSSPQIIILAGPNEAGKSTLAPYLLRDRLGLMEFVNADVIASGLSVVYENSDLQSSQIMAEGEGQSIQAIYLPTQWNAFCNF